MADEPYYRQHFSAFSIAVENQLFSSAQDAPEQWVQYTETFRDRLEAGFLEYGDVSFARSPVSLFDEIQEEMLDIAGWGFVAWCRLGELETQTQTGAIRAGAGVSFARNHVLELSAWAYRQWVEMDKYKELMRADGLDRQGTDGGAMRPGQRDDGLGDRVLGVDHGSGGSGEPPVPQAEGEGLPDSDAPWPHGRVVAMGPISYEWQIAGLMKPPSDILDPAGQTKVNISSPAICAAIAALEGEGWEIVSVFAVGFMVMAAIRRLKQPEGRFDLTTPEGVEAAANHLGVPPEKVLELREKTDGQGKEKEEE